ENGANNVELDWWGGANDTSYNIYRATSAVGPYTQIASGITGPTIYTDHNLASGVYYYKVTGVLNGTETGASNVASASARNELIGQLNFDEGSGATASDATGNGHTGTLNGGATWTAGQDGNAISLDGTSGYVSFATNPTEGLSDFTIAT